jgi:hypothetical protein
LRGIDVARIAEDVPESHAREMLTVCGGAGAWESNVWRSPTRNIACKYLWGAKTRTGVTYELIYRRNVVLAPHRLGV